MQKKIEKDLKKIRMRKSGIRSRTLPLELDGHQCCLLEIVRSNKYLSIHSLPFRMEFQEHQSLELLILSHGNGALTSEFFDVLELMDSPNARFFELIYATGEYVEIKRNRLIRANRCYKLDISEQAANVRENSNENSTKYPSERRNQYKDSDINLMILIPAMIIAILLSVSIFISKLNWIVPKFFPMIYYSCNLPLLLSLAAIFILLCISRYFSPFEPNGNEEPASADVDVDQTIDIEMHMPIASVIEINSINSFMNDIDENNENEHIEENNDNSSTSTETEEIAIREVDMKVYLEENIPESQQIMNYAASNSSTTVQILPDSDLTLTNREKMLDTGLDEREVENLMVSTVTEQNRTDFCKQILPEMCQYQHEQIDQFLGPMLQIDFISLLPSGLAENVLQLLDAKSLIASELICKKWQQVIINGMLWRKFIEQKVRSDPLWRGLAERQDWNKYLFISEEQATFQILTTGVMNPLDAEKLRRIQIDKTAALRVQHKFYFDLYTQILKIIQQIGQNLREGQYRLDRINCLSLHIERVYCLQYDDAKIISGHRNNTIKIWKRPSLHCVQVLFGHTDSVLCLQYDNHIIASGSSDATVRIWDVQTGQQLKKLIHHSSAVLNLRFQYGNLVTCSMDRSIAVWDMASPHEIALSRVLVGHTAAVNALDFDQYYIVSASEDRTIKVWNTSNGELIRTLEGHKMGIACLQYRDGLIVSGSYDATIRLWDIESGNCLRVLEGHDTLVRCIRFDSKRIVSGSYDGKIKIWDLQAALDSSTPSNSLCLKTLSEHIGPVFGLQFDEFQIVSCSDDDIILIWDFLNIRNGNNTLVNEVQNGNMDEFDQSPAVVTLATAAFLQESVSIDAFANQTINTDVPIPMPIALKKKLENSTE